MFIFHFHFSFSSENENNGMYTDPDHIMFGSVRLYSVSRCFLFAHISKPEASCRAVSDENRGRNKLRLISRRWAWQTTKKKST